MNIQVNILTLDQAVKRQLAAIGKRARNAEGKPIFSDVTPSSAEIDTIHDFYADAVTLLNTTSQYFVTAATTPTADGQAIGMVTLTFPTNHNEAMNTTLIVAFSTFLAAYAVYAWLAIVNPAATERYQQAMREKLEALIQIIFHKTPPNHEYVLDVPPTVSSPGTLRLGFNEQRIIAYSLGSDGLDDLDIVSDSAYVTVHKNTADRTFSVINANTTANPIVATVTIGRGTKIAALDSNEQPILDENGDPTYTFTTVLEKIAVSALVKSAEVTVPDSPVLIGFGNFNGVVELQTGDTRKITYTGTIESIVHSGGIIAAAELIAEDGQTKIVITAGANAGRETFMLYGANGWSYTLYCNVMEQQATLPSISPNTRYTITTGATIEIPYTLGSDSAELTAISENAAVSIQNDTQNNKFIISGVSIGQTRVFITCHEHPEFSKTFTVSVSNTVSPTPPSVYVDNTTVNATVGAVSRILFYPGSTGNFSVSSSDSSKVAVSMPPGMDYVMVSCLAVTGDTPVTITFTNDSVLFKENNNNWSFSITVNVAEIPAVETPPIVYFPQFIAMWDDETRNVDYVLGSDNTDDLIVASEDPDICTVSKNTNLKKIIITPVSGADGATYVSVRKPNNDEWHPKCRVIVDKTVQAVSPTINSYRELGSSAITISSGQTSASITSHKQIYVNVDVGNNKHGDTVDITATSSNPSVVSVKGRIKVSGDVLLTPHATGSATVSFYNGSTLLFALSVTVDEEISQDPSPIVQGYQIGTNPYVSLEGLSSASLTIETGKDVQVDVDESDAECEATSSNTSVATVDWVSLGRGMGRQYIIRPEGPGSATITFTSPDNSNWSFVFNIAVQQSGGDSSSNVPEYSSADTGAFKMLYIKGTVSLGNGSSITNPAAIIPHNNKIYLASYHGYFRTYNESTGETEVSQIEITAEKAIAILDAAIAALQANGITNISKDSTYNEDWNDTVTRKITLT